MGGRALKLVYTRRYELDEYLEKQDFLTEILSGHFSLVAVPLYFNNKTSFGDIDIVCAWPHELEGADDKIRGTFLRRYIEETFNPDEIYHNTSSWSFNVDELQVDLIMCEAEHFDSMVQYFSYNDLGNFMGRIANGLGLKYGQEGLMYDHYFKDINIGRVIVSKDYPRIFEFLGFDYNRWEEGFDDLEDVFQYVVDSKYFNYDRYQLDTLNRINRERNLKRDSYMKFLEFIEDYKDRKFEYPKKSESVKKASKFFPEFPYILETRRLEYEYTRKLYIKAKFNGGMVMEKFGIGKMEINNVMYNYINTFSDENAYREFILDNSIHDIYKDFGNKIYSKL